MLRRGISTNMNEITEIMRQQDTERPRSKAQVGHARLRDAVFPPAMDGRQRRLDHLGDS